jgi:hypothetical protein
VSDILILIESIYGLMFLLKYCFLSVNQYFLSFSLFMSVSGCVLYEVIQCDANQNVDSFATLLAATLFAPLLKKWIESIYDVVFL